MTGMAAFFMRHRRRLSGLALVGGLFFAIRDLGPQFPRETELEYAIGPDHGEVIELRVAYRQGPEELAGASFAFPKGAPSSVRHQVKLPTGEFEVWCELRMRSRESRMIKRPLRTPASGVVRFNLADDPG